jgi:LysM repeat protein
VTEDTVTSVRSDGTWLTDTQYAYKDGASWNGSAWTGGTTYEDGNATDEYSVTDKNGAWVSTATTTNSYTWWDGSEQNATEIATVYSGSNTDYTTDYNYDKRNYLSSTSIYDGSSRTIAYTDNADGAVLENNDTASASPATKFFWFDGIQQGDVSNDGTSDVDYVQSIARHTAVPGSGFFTNGGTTPTAYADFDASYQPINGLDVQDTASRYTVQNGDTLQSIAQQIWGDSNFWYLIADANGLNGSSQLTAGMDLIIPNKVANVSNSNSTYRVYDPNLYVGDTSPTHPPKPTHHHGCGIVGQIIETVVSVAVSSVQQGRKLRMAAEPDASIAAERRHPQRVFARVSGDGAHQTIGGALAAEWRRRLDMRNHQPVAAASVGGEGGEPLFHQLEALTLNVVGELCGSCFVHRFHPQALGIQRLGGGLCSAGSRDIHGSISPMGTIHAIPATA